ncbi:MAG TPA: IS1634 family transposase [Bacteroidales bacterium]|nr:IS1634 family transposase [Bacteroidales bacterium]HQI69181.1 IS1634 family transposase [Bacteroidales bacterium]
MFVRKKRNPSGIVSVQIIDKSKGRYGVVKTIGSSADASTIESLYLQGKKWISVYLGDQDIFEALDKCREEMQVTEYLLSNVENILLNGVQLILNNVFKLTGFDSIEDEIFRQLVIARLSQPMSKAATVEYLKSHFDEDAQLHRVYRYLDKLYNTQQEKIQQISVEHTRRILGGKIGLLFYDVTTLYFEADYGDELRETGFSKDGKHSQPQVVLGLLVSKDGYPLSYSVFNGSQYEGRTMLPVVDDFVQRFKLDDFIVVADSGLMSQSNIALLESGNYKYIIGARIKNENDEIKTWALSLAKQDGVFNETRKGRARLIVGYSDNRARKDRYNREKGVKRLEKACRSGNITKENINKRGYNKFLDISDNVRVAINQDKIKQDEQWDGLKGYLTNTGLPAKEVYEQYSGLWSIERAFRITKGTLEMRPVFHFTPKRIEAHVCICFVAYKVYKELERILKISHINMSVDKVLDIAKTITTIKINMPISGNTITQTMLLTPRHKSIAHLFDENFWKNF